MHLRHHQQWGDFRNPKKYTEKIQWRILHDRRDLIALTCDKAASKAYVNQIIAQDPRARELRVAQITWTSKDNRSLRDHLKQNDSPQVLKPNHSSGRYVFIGGSDQTPPIEELTRLVSAWAQPDEESEVFGHWGYGQARVGVFSEERIGRLDGNLVEIRCATFSGEPISYVVTSNVYTRDQTSIAYDADFNRMKIGFKTEVQAHHVGALEQLSEERRKELIGIIRAVSAPFDHVRVDIYDDGNAFWFGELTSYPSSGALTYTSEVERRRGDIWKLPPTGPEGFVTDDTSQAADIWRQSRTTPLRSGH